MQWRPGGQAAAPHLPDVLPVPSMTDERRYWEDPEQVDRFAELASRGLAPKVSSETVLSPTEAGHRLTVNALYTKT